MKVLVTGAGGQLGRELVLGCPEGTELTALTRRDLDITRADDVGAAVRDTEPDVVVNAAAYTAVDRAEAEEDLAFAVNATGASHLAEAARSCGCRLLHLSTDFVFDGVRPVPLGPDDPPRPLSAYGRTKLAGEKAVASIAGSSSLVLRTSWLYSRHPDNFVTTMLDLMKTRSALTVVCDQIGSPTWARHLAQAVWGLAARRDATGILHWSDAGAASWYDFAVAVQELALELGLLQREIPIAPIPTSRYPTPAERPRFSVLDTFAAGQLLERQPLHWRRALRLMLDDLRSTSEDASG